MASKVSLILSYRDTCVKYERGFCAWSHSQQKPLSCFQKFISICSGGAPKDNDKNRKKQSMANFWKNDLKGLFDSLRRDTCVKYERGFCAWYFSQQKPLSVFTNSPPSVWEACRMRMTKTRKKQIFSVNLGSTF
jgi:hypothetical protein